jgi:cobalt-zinc-cadmium efflux system protein
MRNNEIKTLIIVVITLITMIIEITFGLLSKSMSLLADGIHMGSHVGAIGLSWIAYILVRKLKNNVNFKNGTDKILSLSGYTSGLILLFFAIFIFVRAIERFSQPMDIQYNEAILVACIGLIVNLISAVILHQNEKDHDHNMRAAYLHVIADSLTSLTAIIGLISAKYFNLNHLDTIGAIISSIVICIWALGLLKTTSLKLIDYNILKADSH